MSGSESFTTLPSSLPFFPNCSSDPLLEGKRKDLFKRDSHPVTDEMIEAESILFKKETDESMKSVKALIFHVEAKSFGNEVPLPSGCLVQCHWRE